MTDPSSVITQVAAPDNAGPGPAADVPPPESSAAAEVAVPTTAGGGENPDTAAAAGKTGRPPRYRRTQKLLYSFFCCFGEFRRRTGRGKSSGSLRGVSPGAGAGGLAADDKPLLGELRPDDVTKKCMVIDLDETLVHSSFKPISNADFIVPVEIDGTIHQVYVLKRPHVDEFLRRVGELYECVLFTASLAKYADPVCDLLDKWEIFRARLFREHCVFHRGNYVKDLARLGRELGKVVIIDNSPASYIFHPDNAVPVASWFDDMNDQELLDLLPFLESLSKVDNIYSVLRNAQKTLGTTPAEMQGRQMPPMPTTPPPRLPMQ